MAENLLNKVFRSKSHLVSAGAIKSISRENPVLNDQDRQTLRQFGFSSSELSEMIAMQTNVNYDRIGMYKELERSLVHPLMSSAVELYADTATNYSQFANATVWITSANKKYENVLNKLLDIIGIEERVFDWAWSVAAYGDLIPKVEGSQGVGVIAVDDSEHPMTMGRVDLAGRLIGFYQTPFGPAQRQIMDTKMFAPWQYTHFRILGAKRKRTPYGNPLYSEYSSYTLMSPDQRRLSGKYGVSVLNNAIGIYKRLRLTEDALMLARLSKGILKYIYRIKVDGGNMEAVAELIDEYKTILKRARSINPGDGYYDEKYDNLTVNEDIILPVWNDVNDIAVDELGGKTDIRWIADYEEQRNQLASALRIPLPLLGGYTEEMPSGFGRGAIDRYDIRFARQARRVQRAIIDGITRLCQIHLAYLGLDPDPALFDVCMAETSTAEEEELKEALNSGTDAIQKFSGIITDMFGAENVNSYELMNYLNQKILKLDDFPLDKILASDDKEVNEKLTEALTMYKEHQQKRANRSAVTNYELYSSYLPLGESYKGLMKGKDDWQSKYNEFKIEFQKMRK